MAKNKKDDVSSEIIKVHGYLNEDKSKVLATVSWNGRDPKLDIRKCWEKEGELKIGSGISLSEDEASALLDLLPSASNEKDEPPKKKAVDFSKVFASASDIVEKRDAGFTTQDGFIVLRKRPGVKLK